MLIRAYSIFDSKALVYHQPFFAPTNGAAVRMLADTANDLSTSIGRHPSDYVLYCVGQYNDQNGEMKPFSPREHVVDAIALVTIKPTGELFPTELMKQQAKDGKIRGQVAESIKAAV